MTEQKRIRRTVVVPEGMIDAVNGALGLSITSASWRDADGHCYAAASYLCDRDITGVALPGLAVTVFDGTTPVTLQAGHVHIVNGHDGAATLEKLGLVAAEPDLT